MAEVMREAPRPPDLSDFGLTALDLEAAPLPKIGTRSAVCFVAIYGTAVALVFVAALALSGSLIAAVFFGVLLMAAGSVLLVPAVTGLVCALEICEHRWLCRRYIRYRAITEYRRALTDHQAALDRYRAGRARASELFWRELDHAALVAETVRALRAGGFRVEADPPAADSGLDAVVRAESGDWGVRCLAGEAATGRSLGRELTAAASDAGACRVVLVAPWGATPDLASYLEEHSGWVLGGVDLVKMADGAANPRPHLPV